MSEELIPAGTLVTETYEGRKYFYVVLVGNTILCTTGEVKIDEWYVEELVRRLRTRGAEIVE